MTESPTGPTRPPSQPTPHGPPAEVVHASKDARFGKFVRVEKLGAGGMGEVWKAWDTELARWVALKFMKGGDDEELARFQREARAAGGLSHPNIAAIYEVGERDGRPFIAMQFVAGTTLGRLKAPLRERVRLMAEVARAVHAAHSRGIIHRDLKPDNVMVEGGRAYVMDFGLAREVEGGRSLTQSGMALGTPAYMPPEQARGEVKSTDARSDVYSLGATLYAVSTGKPPFDGADTFSILMKVVDEPPRPMRALAPSVPADLETIVMKCLEKDPARRYATAEALADDLDRWRAGEPIEARAPGAVARLGRSLSRRRGFVVTAGIAVTVLALAAAGYGGMRFSADRERERSLERMRTTARDCLAAALDLRRAGNVDGMKAKAAQVEEACRAVLAERPVAEAHYHMGRMYRAQMRWADARREQEAALALDPLLGPARYELFVVRTVMFIDGFRLVQERALAREGERRASEGRGRVRAASARPLTFGDILDAPARRDLEEVEGQMAKLREAPGVTPAEVACAEALRMRARWESGSASALRRALEAMPDAEEAREALIAVLVSAGLVDEGVKEADAAVLRDAGYQPFHEVRVSALMAKGQSIASVNGDAGAWYRRALDAVGEIERRFGLRAVHRRELARAHLNIGLNLHLRGGDAVPPLERSVAEFSEALKLQPEGDVNWRQRGVARLELAMILSGRGRPWEEAMRGALDDYDQAVRMAPGSADAWDGRGNARRIHAVRLEEAGRDATAEYEGSVADHAKALTLNPDQAWYWYRRGTAHMDYGVFLHARGRDPLPQLQAAVEDLTEAIRIDDRDPDHFMMRGMTHQNRAYALAQLGRDAQREYELAMADLGRTVELHRASYDAWVTLGVVAKGLGSYRLARGGKDAGALIREAVRAYGVAIGLTSGRDEAWMRRGYARIDLGRVPGEDPAACFGEALKDFDAAIERNRQRSDTWAGRGLVIMNVGILAYQAEKDDIAVEAFQRSIQDLDEAVKLNPQNADALSYRGHAHRLSGIVMGVLGRGDDARRQLEGAIADYRAAVRIKPAYSAELSPLVEDCRRRMQ